VPPCGSK
jgi:hypothetical protein